MSFPFLLDTRALSMPSAIPIRPTLLHLSRYAWSLALLCTLSPRRRMQCRLLQRVLSLCLHLRVLVFHLTFRPHQSPLHRHLRVAGATPRHCVRLNITFLLQQAQTLTCMPLVNRPLATFRIFLTRATLGHLVRLRSLIPPRHQRHTITRSTLILIHARITSNLFIATSLIILKQVRLSRLICIHPRVILSTLRSTRLSSDTPFHQLPLTDSNFLSLHLNLVCMRCTQAVALPIIPFKVKVPPLWTLPTWVSHRATPDSTSDGARLSQIPVYSLTFGDNNSTEYVLKRTFVCINTCIAVVSKSYLHCSAITYHNLNGLSKKLKYFLIVSEIDAK